ncbi:MAG: hypothetical protein HFF18_06260 [Oscillospiraceae bacterium]|nr:hypothetical protein [Oscillospiraceae bacterium]
MEKKVYQLQDFAAVKQDGTDVLGKVLYYSLSSVMVDKEKLAELCASTGFPCLPTRRTALADAFRSATGDIYERMVLKTDSGPQIFKVYCRDNKAPGGTISRELIKETVREDTNFYKKLANISFDKGRGGFSYDNLASDPHVDPLARCLEAERLFELYQSCASRRQIETMLENYLDAMQAVKIARGKIYFVPRDCMAKLELFEDFIALLEQHNQFSRPGRAPMDANSMFVVDDAKQRGKMAAAFCAAACREIAEYEDRATHLIQSGCQSPAILDRLALRIRGLEQKKAHYEEILKQELNELAEQFTSLRYLSDELQIRAMGLRNQKNAA